MNASADGRGCRQQEAPRTKCSLYCLLNDVGVGSNVSGPLRSQLSCIKGEAGGVVGRWGKLVRIITIGETVAVTCVFRGCAQKRPR